MTLTPDYAARVEPACWYCNLAGIEPGQWASEEPCGDGSSCRKSGGLTLGCVECVGPATPGGNFWGVADSCGSGDEVLDCGPDNRWQLRQRCAPEETCVQLDVGASSLAYCL